MLLRQVLPRAVSRAACTAGNKQRHQRADDRDHDQQFDQRKALRSSPHDSVPFHLISGRSRAAAPVPLFRPAEMIVGRK